jgi:AcrR family transcriptional regulator
MEELISLPTDVLQPGDARVRILAAASELIASGGPEAATTRGVAAAAGVQAPTIYRLFGDKQGLLDAVAEHGFLAYARTKGMREPHPDPVQELRDGWDMHVAFGLANPGLFAIMSSNHRARQLSPAMAAGKEVLRRRIRNIAIAGRLCVSEGRALSLVQSVGTGTVLTLLSEPEAQRDRGLSDSARDMVVAEITGETTTSAADTDHRLQATALRAHLDRTSVLSYGERHLLEELLDRLANDGR